MTGEKVMFITLPTGVKMNMVGQPYYNAAVTLLISFKVLARPSVKPKMPQLFWANPSSPYDAHTFKGLLTRVVNSIKLNFLFLFIRVGFMDRCCCVQWRKQARTQIKTAYLRSVSEAIELY